MPEGRVTLHGVAETTEAGLRRGLGSPALFAIVYSLGAASGGSAF